MHSRVAEIFIQPSMKFVRSVPADNTDPHGRRPTTTQIQLCGRDSHLTNVFKAGLNGSRPIVKTATAETITDARRSVEVGAYNRSTWHVVPCAIHVTCATSAHAATRPARNQKGQSHHASPDHRQVHNLLG